MEGENRARDPASVWEIRYLYNTVIEMTRARRLSSSRKTISRPSVPFVVAGLVPAICAPRMTRTRPAMMKRRDSRRHKTIGIR
jgi:hypothetical protein